MFQKSCHSCHCCHGMCVKIKLFSYNAYSYLSEDLLLMDKMLFKINEKVNLSIVDFDKHKRKLFGRC